MRFDLHKNKTITYVQFSKIGHGNLRRLPSASFENSCNFSISPTTYSGVPNKRTVYLLSVISPNIYFNDNVCLIKIRSKHSSDVVTLLRLLRIFMTQTLYCRFYYKKKLVQQKYNLPFYLFKCPSLFKG